MSSLHKFHRRTNQPVVAATTGDQYFSNVSLLLNAETTDTQFSSVSLLLNGNDLLDHSANPKTVTVNGNTVVNTTTKKYGTGSIYFDGTGDYLSLAANSAFDFGTNDFTIELWFNSASFSAQRTLMSTGGYYTAGKNGNWTFRATNASSIAFAQYNGQVDANGGWEFTVPTMSINTWYHLAVVKKTNIISLYLNGVASSTTYTNTSSISDGGTSTVFVGHNNMGYDGSWMGYIDDLRITKGVARYATNFTPPVAELPTAFSDKSLNALNVTPYGNASINTSTVKYGTGSMYFDGSGDYLSIPVSSATAINGTENFTVETWLHPTAATGYHCFYAIGNWAFQMYMNSSRKIELAFSTSATGGSYITTQQSTGTLALNQWTHVAVTRMGNNFTIFLNGVLDSTFASAGGSIALDTTAYVGCIVGQYFFTGYIDDLRITKGVARYTAAFTPPTQSFPTSAAAVAATDPNFSSVSLLLTGDAFDKSSAPKQFTRYGDVTTSGTQKKYGSSSWYFDGNGDYLSAPSSNDLQLGSSDFTIEYWVNYTTVGQAPVIGKWSGGAGEFYVGTIGNAISLLLTQDGNTASGANTNLISTGYTITTGTWIHVAAVRSGTSVKLYINGTMNTSATITGSLFTGSTPITLGRNPDNGQIFNGYVDDLRITKGVARYTANFTPPTAALPIDSSDPNWSNVSLLLDGEMDRSSSPKAVTMYGNVTSNVTTKKFGTGSMYFDGTGDYLDIPNSVALQILNGAFTIECWVNFASITGNHGLIGVHNNSNDGYFLRTIDANNIRYWNSASGAVDRAYSFTTNTWYHIAVASDGTTGKMFINGVQQGATFTTAGSTQNTGNTFQVGQTSNNGNYLNGYLDDIRITKGVARYTANFTPPTVAAPTL